MFSLVEEQHKYQKTMERLKLSNNKNEATKNLCFVNTLLQILHSINEFSHFFSDRKFFTLQYSPCQCPVSNELCRIFNVNGNRIDNAAKLRRLVAVGSMQMHLCNGEQQCLAEFRDALFHCLKPEFVRIGCDTGIELLNKFCLRII